MEWAGVNPGENPEASWVFLVTGSNIAVGLVGYGLDWF